MDPPSPEISHFEHGHGIFKLKYSYLTVLVPVEDWVVLATFTTLYINLFFSSEELGYENRKTF